VLLIYCHGMTYYSAHGIKLCTCFSLFELLSLLFIFIFCSTNICCSEACLTLRIMDCVICVVIGKQSSFCESPCSVGCSDSYCRTYAIENAYQGLLVMQMIVCHCAWEWSILLTDHLKLHHNKKSQSRIIEKINACSHQRNRLITKCHKPLYLRPVLSLY